MSILVEQRIVDADLVAVLAEEESLRNLVGRVEAPGSMTTRSSLRIQLLYDAIVERISVVRSRFVWGTRATALETPPL